MHKRGVLLFATLFVATRPAIAQDDDPKRYEALVSAGIGFRHATKIDLAEQAGESGYGEGDDTSPGSLGFEVRGGVLFPFPLEVDVTASIAVGGLAIADVERRYFGSTDQIGGSGVASVAASPRYAPMVLSDLRLLVGPSTSLSRMYTASGIGAARIDLVGIGLDAGLRYRINAIGSVADGHLELIFFARREIPLNVYVARGQNDVLFSGTGGGDPIYSWGTSIAYVFSFHRFQRRPDAALNATAGE